MLKWSLVYQKDDTWSAIAVGPAPEHEVHQKKTELDYNKLDLSTFVAIMMSFLPKVQAIHRRRHPLRMRYEGVGVNCRQVIIPDPTYPEWTDQTVIATLVNNYDDNMNAYVWGIYQKYDVFPLVSTDDSNGGTLTVKYQNRIPDDYTPGDDTYPGYHDDFEDYPLWTQEDVLKMSAAQCKTLGLLVQDVSDLSEAEHALAVMGILMEVQAETFEDATANFKQGLEYQDDKWFMYEHGDRYPTRLDYNKVDDAVFMAAVMWTLRKVSCLLKFSDWTNETVRTRLANQHKDNKNSLVWEIYKDSKYIVPVSDDQTVLSYMTINPEEDDSYEVEISNAQWDTFELIARKLGYSPCADGHTIVCLTDAFAAVCVMDFLNYDISDIYYGGIMHFKK